MKRNSPPSVSNFQFSGFSGDFSLECNSALVFDELEEQVQLSVTVDTEKAPRGYLESVEQRLRLLEEGDCSLVDPDGWQGALTRDFEFELRVDFFDGESLPSYLERLKKHQVVNGFELLGDLLKWLQRLASKPRIFSNVTESDFSVYSIAGRLEVGFMPVSALFRIEETKSDRQLAQEWLSYTAELSERVLPRQIFGVSAKEIGVVCRNQLSEIRAGKAHELSDWFRAIVNSVEAERSKWNSNNRRTKSLASMVSKGRLGALLWASYSESEGKDSDEWLSIESPYSATVAESEGDRRRVRLLLPENWTDSSMLDGVNRKMAHPFLKRHHNGFRTLSISCGENYTALVGTAHDPVSLPTLLALKSDCTFDEMHAFLRRIHRALEQFESADFLVDLDSIHQVFIFLEESDGKNAREIFRQDFSEWPAWDVKIRVEPPVEKFVDQSGWKRVYRMLGQKFFPSFACWALDYSRFRWAVQAGRIDNEPSSWDVELESLLTVASKHLDENDALQRQKFLDLLYEWNMSGTLCHAVG